MKTLRILPVLLLLTAVFSCRKNNPGTNDPGPGNVITNPLPDTSHVLLKDIVRTDFPSPYLHFDYNTQHDITQIDFANNFSRYDLSYENGRLVKMINEVNGNEFNYTYDAGKVILITEVSSTGTKLWKYFFDYAGNKLFRVTWYNFVNAVDSVPYKKILLSYLSDDNLFSIDVFRPQTTGGPLEFDRDISFFNYDSTINVDHLSVYNDFFSESLIYLPGIILQKNNHHSEIITSVDNEFSVTYDYQTSNGLPLNRTRTTVQTSGAGTGQQFVFHDEFSYY